MGSKQPRSHNNAFRQPGYNFVYRKFTHLSGSTVGGRLSGNSLRERGKQVLRALTGVLGHEGINDNKGRHSLNNRHSTRGNARIVTTLGLEGALREIVGSGVLSLTDSSSGLESHAEVDGSTVRDTTLDTARVVGLGGKTGAVGDEGVVVDGARDLAATETRADFEALGGGDAEHGVAELGFELVEAGLTQTNGHVANHTCDGSADAVVVVAELLDDLGHAGCGVGVGTTSGDEGVHGVAVDCLDHLKELGVGGGRGVLGSRGEEVLVANGGDEGDDFDAVRQAEVLLGDGTGSDTAWGWLAGVLNN